VAGDTKPGANGACPAGMSNCGTECCGSGMQCCSNVGCYLATLSCPTGGGGGGVAEPTSTITPTGTPEVGMCSLLTIKKWNTETALSDALSVAELGKLTVGDKYRLFITGSINNLRGRFKIIVTEANGIVTGEDTWLTGTTYPSDTKLVYYDYTITKAGTYKFEGQVTTIP